MKYILFLLLFLASISYVMSAVCSSTCSRPACTTITVSENATGKTLVQGEIYYGYTVTFSLGGLCLPGDTCSFSGGACPLMLMQNTSSGDSVIGVNDPDRGVKCGNSSGCTISNWLAKTGGQKYTLLIKGSAIKQTTTFWRGCTSSSCATSVDSDTDDWTTSIGTPTITLSKPNNNTITDSENVVFMANWTGLMDCDNMSLWFNTTKNFTTPSLPLKGNISTTVHFDEYFFGYWNATCCYSHSCSGGGQRNFTFTRMPKFNVSLTLPENNSNRSLFDWTQFVANKTADMKTIPDNYSIYINGSYLNSDNLTHNLSLNLSYLYWGNTTWDVLVCFQHWCRWSINGNNTFIRNSIPIILESSLIIKHPENFQKKPVSHALLWILLIVGFISVMVWLFLLTKEADE